MGFSCLPLVAAKQGRLLMAAPAEAEQEEEGHRLQPAQQV